MTSAIARSPKLFSFTLQGTRLLKPEIADFQAGKDLASWKGSEESKSYKTKLFYRHLDEKEWTELKADSVETETAWATGN